MQVEPVGPAVERRGRLVVAGLTRHLGDGRRRDVRRVRDEQVDLPPQAGGQRPVQVAGVYLPDTGQVASGAPHGCGVEVGGVQLEVLASRRAELRRERRAHGARAAAQVDRHEVARESCGHVERGLDQQPGASAGHEDARLHLDAQAPELRPAQHLLERLAGHAPRDERRQPAGVHGGWWSGGLDEQPRLVLGEHAAGRPQRGHDVGGGLGVGHSGGHAQRSGARRPIPSAERTPRRIVTASSRSARSNRSASSTRSAKPTTSSMARTQA